MSSGGGQHAQSTPKAEGEEKNLLKDVDFSVLQQCMHCGMCLPTCPTYDATKRESASPRGRIAMMRAVAEDRLEVTQKFADEMYFCLGCLACETACPAGVQYNHLIELARAQSEKSGVLANPKRSLIRGFFLRWLFTSRTRMRLAGRLLRLQDLLGVSSLLNLLAEKRLLPKRLRELVVLSPRATVPFSEMGYRTREARTMVGRGKVGVLAGCVQDICFADVNRDTIFVLEENGYEVLVPQAQQCCGSLHGHNGDEETARHLARVNLDAFDPASLEAIIVNAAGCGSHMRHYDRLLEDDPHYAEKARIWSSKLFDVSEFLVKRGFRVPSPTSAPVGKKIVTYHDACHLNHAQKISNEPRKLVKSIPGFEYRELKEAAWCCGSAGIYNLVHPDLAAELGERKVNHVLESGADVVVSANPGCTIQIASSLRAKGKAVEVIHPVTLLAQAYRRET
jgi:glycolate oxidase iron-sulfur subunit